LLAIGVTRALGPFAGNVVGFVTLIAPVTLAAAWRESGARQATPGKIVMKLLVTDRRSKPLTFRRTLARNAVKYALPWELGHTLVFALFGTTSAPAAWVDVTGVLAYALPIVSVILLFVGSGRPLHDRIAGTQVEPQAQH
jgi:uncharacterized RDD family membrane protein YckC